MKSSSTRRQRAAWLVVLLLWICFIWGHSLVNGMMSSQESGRFVSLIVPLAHVFGCYDLDVLTFIVRKCAHFSEYAVLGILVIHTRKVWESSRLLPWIFVAATPFIDETIQRFVPGRSSSLRDVCIDLCGMLTGALIALGWQHFGTNKSK